MDSTEKNDGRRVGLDNIPPEIHGKILSFLLPHERLNFSKVNTYWRTLAFGNCKKIVFVEAEAKEFLKFVTTFYGGYDVFRINDWNHFVESLIAVSQVSRISHLAITNCYFKSRNEVFRRSENLRTWKSCGENLKQLKCFSLHKTSVDVELVSALLAQTSALETLDMQQHRSLHRGQAKLLTNVLAKNKKTLKNLKIYDELDVVDEIPTRSLQSLYVMQSSLYSRRFLDAFAADSMALENIRELHLSFVNSEDAKKIGGENIFPRLRFFSMFVEGTIIDAEECPCIFNQNHNLEVLNVNLCFRDDASGYKIARRYKSLKLLRFDFFCRPSRESLAAISSLKQLKALIWYDVVNIFAFADTGDADGILAATVSSLPELVFLDVRPLFLEKLSRTEAALFASLSTRLEKCLYVQDGRAAMELKCVEKSMTRSESSETNLAKILDEHIPKLSKIEMIYKFSCKSKTTSSKS